MVLVIGEILFDLFPDARRIGGAPFNFAFHLRHLGFDVRFVSRVGDDEPGRALASFLKASGFPPEDLQTDPARPTGRVSVSIARDGSHRFHIARDAAYDYIEFDDRLKKLCAAPPVLVYYGTLIQRTGSGRALVRDCLAAAGRSALKFCDINLRKDCYTPETVSGAVAAADILKLSDEELPVLAPNGSSPPAEQAMRLAEAAGLDTLILTRGSRGSLWASSGSCRSHPVPDGPAETFVDAVGAGDAYAAMAAAGRLSGLPDPDTMALAQDFAGRICGIPGALPGDASFYTAFKHRLSQ